MPRPAFGQRVSFISIGRVRLTRSLFLKVRFIFTKLAGLSLAREGLLLMSRRALEHQLGIRRARVNLAGRAVLIMKSICSEKG